MSMRSLSTCFTVKGRGQGSGQNLAFLLVRSGTQVKYTPNKNIEHISQWMFILVGRSK